MNLKLVSEGSNQYGTWKNYTGILTHADRVRSMTDEELADFIWGVETAGRAYGPRGEVAWLKWLKQEVTNEQTD